jgi:thiamine pyrophosphate-dependent acetolactate synthase large subunit-like protein
MAQPDRPVVVLMGDGGIGWQGMEYETAIRHKLPFVGIVSNNGGFTARSTAGGVGREMGHVRYDKMVEAFGGYGEYVEKPEDIAPALKRAMDSGLPACVNVKVDPDVVGVKMMTLLKIKQSMEAAGQ